MSSRMHPKIRKDQILLAAVETARVVGYHNFTRQDIAETAEISMSLINHYYSTMAKLRRAVMRYAVKHEVYCIIAIGLTTGDKQAFRASPELRALALIAPIKGGRP